MTLTAATRGAIHAYLIQEGTRFIHEGAKAPDKSNLQPFQARLAPVPFAAWQRWGGHSFSTRSGSWFQEIALQVARQYHREAHINYRVTGSISPLVEGHIAAIIAEFDVETVQERRIPNREADIAAVTSVQTRDAVVRNVISDLFVLTDSGEELYFEIKTPQPNKGQSEKMKRTILLISALRREHPASARAAAAYNPFGDGTDFAAQSRGWVRQFLDIGSDFLIGRAFWSVIGTETTYDEILDIAEAVGKELTPLFLKTIEDVTP